MDNCREQKYTCNNDITIYLIENVNVLITQKHYNCDTETVYVLWIYVSKKIYVLARCNIL
jgi:hypothetical protein